MASSSSGHAWSERSGELAPKRHRNTNAARRTVAEPSSKSDALGAVIGVGDGVGVHVGDGGQGIEDLPARLRLGAIERVDERVDVAEHDLGMRLRRNDAALDCRLRRLAPESSSMRPDTCVSSTSAMLVRSFLPYSQNPSTTAVPLLGSW